MSDAAVGVSSAPSSTVPGGRGMRGAGRRGIAVLGARLVAVAVQFLLFLTLARGFGAAEAGLFWLSYAIWGFSAVLLRLGMNVGSTKLVAAALASGTDDTNQVAGAGLTAAVAMGVLGALALFLLAPVFAAAFHEPRLTTQIRVAVIGLPGHAVVWVGAGLLQGAHRVGIAAWARQVLTYLGMTVVLGVLLAVPGLREVPTAAALAIAPNIIGALVLLWCVREFGLRPTMVLDVRSTAFRKLLRYSLPLLLVSAFVAGGNLFDTLVAGLFLDVQAIGVYASAVRVSRFVQLGSLAALAVFAPVAAGLYERGNRARLTQAYKASARWGWIIGLPVATLLLVRPELVLHMFGVEFSAGAGAVRIITLGRLVSVLTGPCGVLLTMTEYQRVEAVNSGLLVVANVMLGVLLIPPLGIAGAALAAALSLSAVNLLRMTQGWRYVGIGPFSMGMLRAGAAAFVTAGVLWIVPHSPAWSMYTQLGVTLMICGGTYGIALAILRLDNEDWQVMKAAVSRQGGSA